MIHLRDSPIGQQNLLALAAFHEHGAGRLERPGDRNGHVAAQSRLVIDQIDGIGAICGLDLKRQILAPAVVRDQQIFSGEDNTLNALQCHVTLGGEGVLRCGGARVRCRAQHDATRSIGQTHAYATGRQRPLCGVNADCQILNCLGANTLGGRDDFEVARNRTKTRNCNIAVPDGQFAPRQIVCKGNLTCSGGNTRAHCFVDGTTKGVDLHCRSGADADIAVKSVKARSTFSGQGKARRGRRNARSRVGIAGDNKAEACVFNGNPGRIRANKDVDVCSAQFQKVLRCGHRTGQRHINGGQIAACKRALGLEVEMAALPINGDKFDGIDADAGHQAKGAGQGGQNRTQAIGVRGARRYFNCACPVGGSVRAQINHIGQRIIGAQRQVKRRDRDNIDQGLIAPGKGVVEHDIKDAFRHLSDRVVGRRQTAKTEQSHCDSIGINRFGIQHIRITAAKAKLQAALGPRKVKPLCFIRRAACCGLFKGRFGGEDRINRRAQRPDVLTNGAAGKAHDPLVGRRIKGNGNGGITVRKAVAIGTQSRFNCRLDGCGIAVEIGKADVRRGIGATRFCQASGQRGQFRLGRKLCAGVADQR